MLFRFSFFLSIVFLLEIGAVQTVNAGSVGSGSLLFEEQVACEPTPPDRQEADDDGAEGS